MFGPIKCAFINEWRIRTDNELYELNKTCSVIVIQKGGIAE